MAMIDPQRRLRERAGDGRPARGRGDQMAVGELPQFGGLRGGVDAGRVKELTSDRARTSACSWAAM
jgi:hypothetical protein